MKSEKGFTKHDYINRTMWLLARYKGVGASEAAAMCGKSRWGNNIELWTLKVGQGKPSEGNEDTERGHKLEDPVRQRFMEKYGEYFELIYEPFTMYTNLDYPMLYATLDGILVVKKDCTIQLGDKMVHFCKGDKVILEIKNPAPRTKAMYDSWNTMPEHYCFQGSQQMLCTGIDCHILVSNITGDFQKGDEDWRIFFHTFTDFKAYTEEITYTAPVFWKYVVDKVQPPTKISMADGIEVVLDSPIEGKSVINDNFAQALNYINESIEPYKGMAVTADSYPEAKEAHKKLQGMIDTIEEKRKAIKKAWNEPYLEFEKRSKALVNAINGVREPISKGINQIVDSRRAEKNEKVTEYISRQLSGEFRDICELYLAIGCPKEERWSNITASWEDIKPEVDRLLHRIRDDYSEILSHRQNPDRFRIEMAGYIGSKGNISKANEMWEIVDNNRTLLYPKASYSTQTMTVIWGLVGTREQLEAVVNSAEKIGVQIRRATAKE